jgi:hypothetical protein
MWGRLGLETRLWTPRYHDAFPLNLTIVGAGVSTCAPSE